MRATTALTPTTPRDHRLASSEAADGAQYSTFRLAGEQYGIDILKVREIRGWARVTQAPNFPPSCWG